MRNWIIMLLLLGAATALFSVPAVYYFDTVAVGDVQGPAFDRLWRMWAAPTAFFGNHPAWLSPQDLFIGPESRHNVLSIWAVPLVLTPVSRVFGATAAVNFFLLLTLFLNGLFVYIFLREVVGDHGPALAAGMAFAFSTFVLSRIAAGELETAAVFVLPLGAWAVVRLCDRPSWRTEVIAMTVSLFAIAWHATFGWAVLVFAVAAMLWTWLFDKRRDHLGPVLRVLGATAFLWLLFYLFVAAPAVPAAGEPRRGLDLFEAIFVGRAYPDTTPYFLLIVAAIGLLIRRAEAAFWWLAALALFAFSLGDRVYFWGNATPIPGPFALLNAHDPLPLAAMAQLCLAVPAAQAIRAAAEHIERRRPKDEAKLISICVLLGLAVSFFYLPNPAFKTAVPDAYGALHDLDDGAVLELPISRKPAINARYRYYQSVHRHRVIGGGAAPGRPAGLPFAVLQTAPLLKPLDSEPINWIALAGIPPHGLQAQLRAAGIVAVALHPFDLPVGQRDLIETWCEQVFGAPQRRDESTIIYRVTQ